MADTTNQTKLKAFVARHIANAAKRTPADADEYLMKWADWVNQQFDKLGTDAPGFKGLTAFDLAEARDALSAAAVRASSARAAA